MSSNAENSKEDTFSIIDEDPRYDESKNINHIINDLRCKHELIKINNDEDLFFNRLKVLTDYHDGPIATLSYYIHSFLSENISKKIKKLLFQGQVQMNFLLDITTIFYCIFKL